MLGYFYIINHVEKVTDRLCLVNCGFCCTNEEIIYTGGPWLLYPPTDTKKKRDKKKKEKKEATYVYYYFGPGFGSLLQRTILYTFLKRLGKGFVLLFRDLLYSEKCCKLPKVTAGPVWSMGLSGCPSDGQLFPGSKCLPQDEGHATWRRQTTLSGRNMTSVRLLYFKENLLCWKCLMFLEHRKDKQTSFLLILPEWKLNIAFEW